ncbi:hypothetical protein GC194_12320 [bacterium]|nr:hypothetical protein [bacterium]
MHTDSLVQQPDSVVKKDSNAVMAISKSALEAQVTYHAEDSIVYDIINKKVYLYGLAVIDYDDLHLEAHKVVIDWNKNELWAYSKLDSAGKKVKEQVKLADKTRTGEADSIAYNFQSKKGKIYNFRTKEGNAYVIVDEAKKNEKDILYCSDTKFTTCDKKHPHFWLELDKAKIIPNDKVVTSYAYPVIEGVPIYFAFIPFAFIPTNTQKATSGILFPKYGFSQGRGYYLQDGGYYFALSNKLDLSVTADAYSFGSWGLSGSSNYKVRYKYSGSAAINYNKNFFDNGKGEFVPTNEFLVSWSHRQDPKSLPGITFSSSVNVGSAGYNKHNSFDNNQILQSRLRSSVNFGKNFKNTPFRLTVALSHDQNLQNHTINLTLPNTNLSMDRVQPFQNVRNKKLTFLRNLGITHNLRFQNQLSTYDSLLFNPDTTLNWNRGISHSLPVSTSFKIFKWVNVNPSFNYRGYYSFYQDRKSLDDAGKVQTERVNGNFYSFDYNFSTSFNTTLYGTYRFKRSKSLVAMRHQMIPSVNLNYTPDFSTAKWGYFETINTSLTPDTNGIYKTLTYNKYGSNPLGSPQKGKVGSVGFSVKNTLEMKLKDKKDTVNADATKKVKILENLSLDGNYNFFADSLKLSKISYVAYTTLFKRVTIQSRGTFDPYAVGKNGRNYNKFLWETEHKLAQIQQINLNIGTSLKNNIIEAWRKQQRKKGGVPEKKKAIVTPYSKFYRAYQFPFDLRVVFDITSQRQADKYVTTNTLNLTGSFDPTDKWGLRYTFNYDFRNQKVGYTNVKFVRNLHCWEFSFDWTPLGQRKGFYFSLRAKASELQSLKLDKNSNFWDN